MKEEFVSFKRQGILKALHCGLFCLISIFFFHCKNISGFAVLLHLLSFSPPQLSLMTKRSEILRMDKAIAKEEGQLKRLEKIIERDNLNFEEFLRENEKKSVEARTL